MTSLILVTREWERVRDADRGRGQESLRRNPDHVADEHLGQLLLDRVIDSKWVHRRTEKVVFLGAARLRRQVSLDLEVPAALSNAHRDGDFAREWSIVPLALLRKRSDLNDQALLRAFDLRDELGAAVPLLSHYENALAAWSLLCTAVAAKQGGSSLTTKEQEILWDIVAAPSGEASRLARQVLAGKVHQCPALAAVRQDLGLSYLLSRLAEHYLLIAELGDAAGSPTGRRRIIKFAYDDTLPSAGWWRLREGPFNRGFWDALAVLPKEFEFEVGTPLPSRSLHWELEVPGEVEIVHAELRSEARLHPAWSVQQVAVDNRLQESPNIAHVHLSDVPLVAEVTARVLVRLRGNLVSMLAAVAPFVLAAGLWFGSMFPEAVLRETGSVERLLLLIPGLMAGIAFARQRDHLVARLTLVARSMSALTVVLSLTSVVVLATLDPSNLTVHTIRDWWGLLAKVAASVGIVQAIVTMLPLFVERPATARSDPDRTR